MYIQFGFEVDNILYGWKNKVLHKLPDFKPLKLQKFGGSYGYYVNRKPYTLARLKHLTKNINFVIQDIKTMPF